MENGTQSDSELVQAVLQGDRQAYERLFERHERSVLGAWEELDVTLLPDSEVKRLGGKSNSSGSFFEGERLLKEALSAGANVTFWAR